MSRCLCCFRDLRGSDPRCADFPDYGYHRRCAVELFGTAHAPQLGFALDDIEHIGVQVVRSSITVPGVQRKLSLDWQHPDHPRPNDRLTIVGLWGRYILKPPSDEYPQLPENEALIMQLARELKIPTAASGLIPLDSGELCYIVKRFDRDREHHKLAMEDFAQISGRLTEDKYKGSYDRLAKLLAQYSCQPGIDVVRLYELLLFCYVVGNADMHLKNFALYAPRDGRLQLTPAYDLLSTALVIPEDPEECALTLNGRKRNLRVSDWLIFAERAGVAPRAAHKLLQRMAASGDIIAGTVSRSLLSEQQQQALMKLAASRLAALRF
ncbi:HipA domain-containing protein [Spirochaeta dissipatitropha]